MVCLVTTGWYEDTHTVAVLTGPDEPGIEVLQGQFDEAHGVPPYPCVQQPAVPYAEDREGWTDYHSALQVYREARRAALKPKFTEEAYADALVQWLRETHDYRDLRYVEHWVSNL